MSGPLDVASPSSSHQQYMYNGATRQSPVRQASASSWDGGLSPWGSTTATADAQSGSAQLTPDNVPREYVALWHSLDPIGGAISLGSLKQVLKQSSASSSSVDKILNLTVTSPRVNASTFYVALALLARAERGQDLDVTQVMQAPQLAVPTSLSFTKTAGRSSDDDDESVLRPSVGALDPPDYFRGSFDSPRSGPFDSSSNEPTWASTNDTTQAPTSPQKPLNKAANGKSRASIGAEGGDESFADMGYDGNDWHLGRQAKVQVRIRDEMGGFVFKHNVWFVASERGATVERRYSDFVWLLQSLTKRYPFRLLPNLPPKHLQLGGNHVLTDDLFLERRRRGLERFMCALVNHPVVMHDGLLKTFLTERGDLSTWRKNAQISLDEEFHSRALTSAEEASIPADLDTRLGSLRSRILNLIEQWAAVVHAIDRIAHRRQNQGGEWDKLYDALHGVLDVERNGWRLKEVVDVEADEQALMDTSRSMGALEGSSAKTMIDSIVEEVKRHRELYVNFRDLFARHMTLAPDAVEKLRRRTEANLRKLRSIRDSAPGAAAPTPAEFDKLTSAIEADQRQVDLLLRRRVFIRWSYLEEDGQR
ncbi:Sorting nexin mvp1 [Microbotryomycetes sp. JL201]|nr:Sorting nexin mvp1 [Microbotryomycetes sp. JL201]